MFLLRSAGPTLNKVRNDDDDDDDDDKLCDGNP